MGTAGASETGEGAAHGRPADWFERELAALNAQLDEVAAWLATRPASPPPIRRRAAEAAAAEPAPAIGRGLHASVRPAEPAPASAAATPAADSGAVPAPEGAADPTAAPAAAGTPSEPPRPTGTDLSDPKNFGLMPPTADLQPGDISPDEYRQRLARDLAFATTVLHTSKVPAAVWREWRAFERAIHEKLRDL